jgi:tetratricopeptide (TPR) repeat protein
LRINPSYAEAYSDLGAALVRGGKLDEAIACFHEALRLKPALELARQYLQEALSRKEHFPLFQAMGADRTTCNGLLRMRCRAVSLGRWFIGKLRPSVKKKSFKIK